MIRDDFRLTIPNPHRGDIRPALLARILRQAEISREEWEDLSAPTLHGGSTCPNFHRKNLG